MINVASNAFQERDQHNCVRSACVKIHVVKNNLTEGFSRTFALVFHAHPIPSPEPPVPRSRWGPGTSRKRWHWKQAILGLRFSLIHHWFSFRKYPLVDREFAVQTSIIMPHPARIILIFWYKFPLLKSVKVCKCSNRAVLARDQPMDIFWNETCVE